MTHWKNQQFVIWCQKCRSNENIAGHAKTKFRTLSIIFIVKFKSLTSMYVYCLRWERIGTKVLSEYKDIRMIFYIPGLITSYRCLMCSVSLTRRSFPVLAFTFLPTHQINAFPSAHIEKEIQQKYLYQIDKPFCKHLCSPNHCHKIDNISSSLFVSTSLQQ